MSDQDKDTILYWRDRAKEGDATIARLSGVIEEARAKVDAYYMVSLKEPLEVDLSDYGDEWVNGFLHGQEHALILVGEFLARAETEGENG